MLSWSSGLLTMSQRKSRVRAHFSVSWCWTPEDLWNNCDHTVCPQRLCWHLNFNTKQLQKWTFLRNAPEISWNRGCCRQGFHHFLLQEKKGYYFDLAIRAILKILGTVPATAEDVYHTGRRDSPPTVILKYVCRRLSRRYTHLIHRA